MPVNQLLPFGLGTGSNVMSPSDYAGASWRLTGFIAGVAVSQQLNTVWRQSAFTSSMIAQFTVHNSGQDVLDNGDIDTYEANFKAAVIAAAAGAGIVHVDDIGTANVMVGAGSPLITAYATNQIFLVIKAPSGNTSTAPTLNVNSKGAKTIVKRDGAPVAAGDLPPNGLFFVQYDGANMRLLGPAASDFNSLVTVTDTGTADALAGIAVPVLTSYQTGRLYLVTKGSAANLTTTPTLNVSSLGTKTITNRDGSALVAGDLPANAALLLEYDGVKFRLLNFSKTEAVNVIRSIPAVYWRFNTPSQTLPNNTQTQVGGWANTINGMQDSSVNATTGAVTIGTKDAGVYIITAAGATQGSHPSSAEIVKILVNGVELSTSMVQLNGSGGDQELLDQCCSVCAELFSGDVVTMTYLQINSGSTSSPMQLSTYIHFSGARLGSRAA